MSEELFQTEGGWRHRTTYRTHGSGPSWVPLEQPGELDGSEEHVAGMCPRSVVMAEESGLVSREDAIKSEVVTAHHNNSGKDCSLYWSWKYSVSLSVQKENAVLCNPGFSSRDPALPHLIWGGRVPRGRSLVRQQALHVALSVRAPSLTCSETERVLYLQPGPQ